MYNIKMQRHINSIKEGNHSKVLPTLSKDLQEFTDVNTIVNLIVANIHAANNKDVQKKISSMDVYNLTKVCCQNIKSLNEATTEYRYITAMHSVTIRLKEMNDTKSALDLNQFMIWNKELFGTDFYRNIQPYIFYLLSVMKIMMQPDGLLFEGILKSASNVLRVCSTMLDKEPTHIHSLVTCMIQLIFTKKSKLLNDYLSEISSSMLSIHSFLPHDQLEKVYSTFLSCLQILVCDSSKQMEFETTLNLLMVMKTIFRKHEDHTDSIAVLIHTINFVLKPSYKEHVKTEMKNSLNMLKKLYIGSQNKRLVHETSLIVLRIMASFIKELTRLKSTNVSMHKKLIEFADEMSRIFKQMQVSNKNCDCSKSGLHNAINALALIKNICCITLNNDNGDLQVDVHKSLVRSFKQRFQYANDMREVNCSKWHVIYDTIFTDCYNMTIILSNCTKDDTKELQIDLIVMAIQEYNHNLQFKSGEPFLNFTVNCYKILSRTYESMNGRNLESLVAESLHIVHASDQVRSKEFSSFICKKAKCIELCHLSIYDLLTNSKNSYGEDLSKVNFCKLLFRELEAYVLLWPDFDSMMGVCRSVFKLTEDSITRARACILVQKSKMNNKELNNFVTTTLAHVESSLTKLKDTKRQMVEPVMACLLLRKYLIDIEQARVEQASNSDDVLPLIKPKYKHVDHNIRPDDTCDIVPVCDLNIDKENLMINSFKKSYSYWKIAFNNRSELKELFTEVELNNFVQSMEAVALSFSLHGFELNKYRMLQLSYKFAKYLKDEKAMFTIMCYLLENQHKSTEEINKIVKEMDSMSVTYLNGYNDQDKAMKETLLNYMISYALYNYHCQDYKECVVNLQYVCNKLKGYTEPPKMVVARLNWAKSIVKSVDCLKELNIGKTESMVSSLVLTYELFSVLRSNSGLSGYLWHMCLTMDMLIFIGNFFLLMSMHRRAYCYLKTGFQIAQKYALVNRVATVISLLAQTDLLCENADDCQVKLEGLKSLLQVDNRKTFVGIEEITPVIEDTTKLKLYTDRKNSLSPAPLTENIMRDMESSHLTRRQIQGSPLFKQSSFVLPDFTRHIKQCTCNHCSSPQYFKLILEMTHIEAQLNSLQNNHNIALDYHNGCLKLETIYMQKKKYLSKTEEYGENENQIFDLSAAKIFLDYALFLKSNNKDTREISEMTYKAIELLKYKNYHSILLMGDILFLNTSFIFHTDKTSADSNKIPIEEEQIVITPERKQSLDYLTPANLKPSVKKIAPILARELEKVPERFVEKNKCNLASDISSDADETIESPKESFTGKKHVVLLKNPVTISFPPKMQAITPIITISNNKSSSSSSSDSVFSTPLGKMMPKPKTMKVYSRRNVTKKSSAQVGKTPFGKITGLDVKKTVLKRSTSPEISSSARAIKKITCSTRKVPDIKLSPQSEDNTKKGELKPATTQKTSGSCARKAPIKSSCINKFREGIQSPHKLTPEDDKCMMNENIKKKHELGRKVRKELHQMQRIDSVSELMGGIKDLNINSNQKPKDEHIKCEDGHFSSDLFSSSEDDNCMKNENIKKNHELGRKVRKELHQVQRIDSVSELAGGIQDLNVNSSQKPKDENIKCEDGHFSSDLFSSESEAECKQSRQNLIPTTKAPTEGKKSFRRILNTYSSDEDVIEASFVTPKIIRRKKLCSKTPVTVVKKETKKVLKESSDSNTTSSSSVKKSCTSFEIQSEGDYRRKSPLEKFKTRIQKSTNKVNPVSSTAGDNNPNKAPNKKKDSESVKENLPFKPEAKRLRSQAKYFLK